MAAIDERDDSIVGVSRYVAYPSRPAVADVAVEVADAFQDQGIGVALAQRTLSDASANGLSTLTATTLWENGAARALLRRFGFQPRRTRANELEMALDLAPAEAPAACCPGEGGALVAPMSCAAGVE